MGELKATPWVTGTDMFGAHHVYNSDGRRITNDQMCGTEGWAYACHLMAASPDLYAALDAVRHLISLDEQNPFGSQAQRDNAIAGVLRSGKLLNSIDSALSKARGEQ